MTLGRGSFFSFLFYPAANSLKFLWQPLDLFNILRFYYFEITWFISMAILYIYLPNILKLVFSFSLTVCFCCHLLTFFSKFSSSKNSFRNTIRVSNGLNPGCELVPNCLQRLSADNKSLLSRKELKCRKSWKSWQKYHWNMPKEIFLLGAQGVSVLDGQFCIKSKLKIWTCYSYPPYSTAIPSPARLLLQRISTGLSLQMTVHKNKRQVHVNT